MLISRETFPGVPQQNFVRILNSDQIMSISLTMLQLPSHADKSEVLYFIGNLVALLEESIQQGGIDREEQ